MQKHPNAKAAGGSAGALAVILYLLTLVGVELPEPPLPVGIILGGAVSGLVLFIGRNGVRGLFRLVWRGRS